MKDLIVGMFSAKQYLGNETNETLQRMRDNFFEILKNTIWFRDFERCILKNLNCFWRYYMNLDVPDYWFYSGPSTNSIEALEKIRRFLMKKLQVNETNLYNLWLRIFFKNWIILFIHIQKSVAKNVFFALETVFVHIWMHI